ncbi:MAG: hypothetical protein IPJ07_09535 [Acidobacteria bacterium]|nr:hypothetical protein [Acidobacteriota bacterium]
MELKAICPDSRPRCINAEPISSSAIWPVITILDRNNKLVTHLGDNVDPRKRGTNKVGSDGWLDGFNSHRTGLLGSKGNLYVEEWMSIGLNRKVEANKNRSTVTKPPQVH